MRGDQSKLRRLAKQLLPNPGQEWSLGVLVSRTEEITKQQIKVVEVSPSAISGLCGSRLEVDGINWICVPTIDSEETSLAREIVTVHELAHIACGHTTLSSHNANMLVRCMQSTLPGLELPMLRLAVDDVRAAAEEQEAERLTALILKEAKPPLLLGEFLSSARNQGAVDMAHLFGAVGKS